MSEDRRLLYLVIGTLIFVGSGVIWAVYGRWALLTAVPVLIFGVFLILVPYLLLSGLQKWRDKIERDARLQAGIDRQENSLPANGDQEATTKEGANR